LNELFLTGGFPVCRNEALSLAGALPVFWSEALFEELAAAVFVTDLDSGLFGLFLPATGLVERPLGTGSAEAPVWGVLVFLGVFFGAFLGVAFEGFFLSAI
jgi:hypothetical protein